MIAPEASHDHADLVYASACLDKVTQHNALNSPSLSPAYSREWNSCASVHTVVFAMVSLVWRGAQPGEC